MKLLNKLYNKIHEASRLLFYPIIRFTLASFDYIIMNVAAVNHQCAGAW